MSAESDSPLQPATIRTRAEWDAYETRREAAFVAAYPRCGPRRSTALVPAPEREGSCSIRTR